MKYNDRSEFEKVDSFGIGAPNDAYAQYFTGNSFLKPLTEFGKVPVFMANVTSSCNKWWRSDFSMYCRRGLVSGRR